MPVRLDDEAAFDRAIESYTHPQPKQPRYTCPSCGARLWAPPESPDPDFPEQKLCASCSRYWARQALAREEVAEKIAMRQEHNT